jgi:transcriptional regulator with XRE-family HTH domain
MRRYPLIGLRVDGDAIKKIRRAAGLTQQEVAFRAGISDRWYRLIERHGQQPSRPDAEEIAKILGCKLSDFADHGDAAGAA